MLGHALADILCDHELLLWDKNDLDITNREEVRKAVAREKPDVLVNAAAFTDVDGCETQRELAMAVNAQGVGNLADACAAYGASMVHYSTDYVFDGKKAEGYREDDQPQNPVNFYGRSKLAGEELFLSPLEHLNSETLNFYLVRTSWLFGPHGKNFPFSMLERARAGKKELTVVNDQHGRPTYTHDLALGTLNLVNSFMPSGIYHLTNAVSRDTVGQKAPSITWYDFAVELFSQAARNDSFFADVKVRPCLSSEFPRPAPRPRYSILENTKLPPLRPWQEALSDYLSRIRFLE